VNVLCHREQLGVHPCDRRRTISEYRTLFPTVDWSLMTDEKDVQWTSDKRETEDEITARGCQFLSMVMKRPEQSIAVVSHSSFLKHLFISLSVGHSYGKFVKGFKNCELRTVVIADVE
jgi:broad specificity phosphatase PhoE